MEPNAFSYAETADPFWKRTAIDLVERATGREYLKRLYFQKKRDNWGGVGFFDAAISALALDLRYDHARLAAIPRSGPLVVVANHPYGVLDGIVICALMQRVRPDFRLLINAVLMRAPEMRTHTLPIHFTDAPGVRRVNAASRAAAVDHARQGGCVVIFPAGGVSTSPDRLGRLPAVDAPWTPYLARLVAAGRCAVLPIYFPGQNSRLFQIASHLSLTLRLSLIFHEVRRRMGTPVEIAIGDPIAFADLAGLGDRQAIVDFLRHATLSLKAKEAQPRPL